MIDKLLAIFIAQFSEYIWRALLVEARVYRQKQELADRIKEFRQHVDDIEKSEFQDDALKNERLDNAARTLLYGVRKPIP